MNRLIDLAYVLTQFLLRSSTKSSATA